MRAGRRRGGGGFSLIEVMVAIAVLAIGLTGMIGAIVGATRLDRRFNARAAAHSVAVDLAREIERWDFTDPRLSSVHGYTGADFAEPTVLAFTLVPGDPPAVTETLSAPPDHTEAECGPCGRDLQIINGQEPGSIYVFRRYWNVTVDPQNAHLKLVAVHVTYGWSSSSRGVTTVFTSVHDQAALLRAALKEGI
jgi:prepilin-type N-terminal cleavage/methylation domain-containing protein